MKSDNLFDLLIKPNLEAFNEVKEITECTIIIRNSLIKCQRKQNYKKKIFIDTKRTFNCKTFFSFRTNATKFSSLFLSFYFE